MGIWLVALAVAASPSLTKHTVAGGDAVILASLMDRVRLPGNGQHSHDLSCAIGERQCKGSAHASFEIRAGRIACEESHVAVGSFRCELSASGGDKAPATRTLSGHAAYELMSVLRQAGIPVEGAAGHSEVVAQAVTCTIDPAQLSERAGGGARCELLGEQGTEPPSGQPSL